MNLTTYSRILLVMGLILFCLGMYWLFWPVDVMDIRSVELQTTDNKPSLIFKRGDTVNLALVYDKYLPLTGDLSRTMVKQDEPHKGLIVTIIASRPGNLPVGLNQEAVSFFVIPVTAPIGKYIMHTNARYRVNPLRDFYEDWDSPEYEVK